MIIIHQLLSFNTSHVTVQPTKLGTTQQNISSFNTSHVTVQLKCHTCGAEWYRFQYIPCYCSTSTRATFIFHKYVSIHPMLLFNLTRTEQHWINFRFNTSHVTVQHPSLEHFFEEKDCFNTSHVTVQRAVPGCLEQCAGVSIHPMLLFNTANS